MRTLALHLRPFLRFYALGKPMDKSFSIFPKISTSGFVQRHVGPTSAETEHMLTVVGYPDKDAFLAGVLPNIATKQPAIQLPEPITEAKLMEAFRNYGSMNQLFKSYIGHGYYGTVTPPPIKRNVLENPAWYTQYTPYQPEISQGRLEALFNFQTMVSELTKLPIANASLLDEATAACEAMTMLYHCQGKKKNTFLVEVNCFPNTIACVRTRAEGLGLDVKLVDSNTMLSHELMHDAFGYLFQYPDKTGSITINDHLGRLQSQQIPTICATDLLALALLKPPGELGADVAVGSSQRFGVPLGFGGPHAAFFAAKEKYLRYMPGRIVGLSKDAAARPAYRLALQTREQHIRRERAISNICTAQALLANVAGMYAVYHGPEGLKQIANRINSYAVVLGDAAERVGHTLQHSYFFDTIVVKPQNFGSQYYHDLAAKYSINLGRIDDSSFSISIDETFSGKEMEDLVRILSGEEPEVDKDASEISEIIFGMEPANDTLGIPKSLARNDRFMQQSVFQMFHTETQLVRYIHHLQSKDLSLVHSMIPLGSCTMKLNATSQLGAMTMPEFVDIHPLVPWSQARGYEKMLGELKEYLGRLTGLSSVSLQPNSGAQGEYVGLRVIRAYHERHGEGFRNICIIPESAHGTNPASAICAGLQVRPLKCRKNGQLDMDCLDGILQREGEAVAAIMVTYPSTFGLFDETIIEAGRRVRQVGGLVYMDGANMNAMCSMLRPSDIGADACHLNLHKTFCIPHGGGGPGAGPIAVYPPEGSIKSERLAPFLPLDPLMEQSGFNIGPIAGSPFGSASILSISWAYIRLMGLEGLQEATFKALLNANYMMSRLMPYYPIKYVGERATGSKRCGHEFVVDLGPFLESANITAIDVAKRLQDYGFHSPTMSWPVPNSLMIEPTESESLDELERFIHAMIGIRQEIGEIEKGAVDREHNVLKGAPHPIADLVEPEWDRPYTRPKAAFPLPSLREAKFWPTTGRLDDVYGDRCLSCTRAE